MLLIAGIVLFVTKQLVGGLFIVAGLILATMLVLSMIASLFETVRRTFSLY